jgi:hypothetical protein
MRKLLLLAAVALGITGGPTAAHADRHSVEEGIAIGILYWDKCDNTVFSQGTLDAFNAFVQANRGAVSVFGNQHVQFVRACVNDGTARTVDEAWKLWCSMQEPSVVRSAEKFRKLFPY